MNTQEQWKAKGQEIRELIAKFMRNEITEGEYHQRVAVLKKEHLEIGFQELQERIAKGRQA